MIETNGMESCIIDCVSCILAQILCHLSKSMDSMQSYKLFQSVYDFAVFNLSVFQCVLIRNDTMPFVLLIIKDGNSSNYLLNNLIIPCVMECVRINRVFHCFFTLNTMLQITKEYVYT
eukprot:97130_1